MKVNINKFQKGGEFVQFTPVLRSLQQLDLPTQKEDKSSSSSSSSSKKGLVDDDLYKELIGKGLTNDVNLLVDELVKIEQRGFSNPDDPTRTLRLLAKVNEIQNNKENWKNAVKTAESSGGLGEIAVNSNGEVYIRGERGIQTMSLEQYKKSKDKVKTLTVSELMNARQMDPKLAYNNSIFSIAQQSIGVDKINDRIKTLVLAFGEETMNSERHYSKDQIINEVAKLQGVEKPNAAQLKALNSLYELMNTPGDYVKVVEKDSSTRNQIEVGLQYLMTSLPKEQQLKLKAVAIQNNRNGAEDYIIDALTTFTKQSKTSNITPSKEADDAGKSRSGSSSNEKNLTRFQLFNNGKLLGAYADFSFNDPELNTLFRGTVGGLGPLVDKNDDNIGMVTLKQLLQDNEYNAIVNGAQVFFGDKPVSYTDLRNIVYDGEEAARIYMPVGRDGMPDWEANERFKKLYDYYEQHKNELTVKQAEDLFKSENFNLKISEDEFGDKIIMDNQWVKPFLVLNAYTNTATGLVEEGSKFAKKLTSDETDNILTLLDPIWIEGTGKSAKVVRPDKSWHIEKYYKGIVTIPYRKDAAVIANTMVKQGPKDQQASLATVQQRLNNSNVPSLNNVSASVLKNK